MALRSSAQGGVGLLPGTIETKVRRGNLSERPGLASCTRYLEPDQDVKDLHQNSHGSTDNHHPSNHERLLSSDPCELPAADGRHCLQHARSLVAAPIRKRNPEASFDHKAQPLFGRWWLMDVSLMSPSLGIERSSGAASSARLASTNVPWDDRSVILTLDFPFQSIRMCPRDRSLKAASATMSQLGCRPTNWQSWDRASELPRGSKSLGG